MKRNTGTVYATLCVLLLVGGLIGVFFFAWNAGVMQAIHALVGIVAGFVLAPVIHELGHLYFAQRVGMRCVYLKCFCFRAYEENGKRRFSFASPFAPDETQVIPCFGGDMQKRALCYASGGLIAEGVYTALLVISATLCTIFHATQFWLWGAAPYAGYLFILNALPLEYPLGKTDALIVSGIKKGFESEKVFLSAMEIQGRLYAGESYARIPQDLYFDLPQLREDEPLFFVIQEMRYRYFLERGEFTLAADALNRLVQAKDYATDIEAEKIAAELTYMHALNGDLEWAVECGKLCSAYLSKQDGASLRVLAAYAFAFGEKEKARDLVDKAFATLENEGIKGYAESERILLARIQEKLA